MFNPSTEIWLSRIETELRRVLDAGETPFLGLYAGLFKPEWKQYLRDRLQALPKPVQGYLRALDKWPAVLATYLTVHVVEGYGQGGTHAVYTHIEQALTNGKRQLTLNEREKLWRAFRRACATLGLDVLSRQSGTNYMVDEYLHQAGVPLQYVAKLTERMLRFAQVTGLPEDDDPASIRLWQDGLLERLRAPLSVTIPHAIQADDNGFYVRLFVRLAQGSEPDDEGSLGIKQAMGEVLQRQSEAGKGALHKHRLTIPKVVWRDEMLMVDLPAGGETMWRISVGGDSREYLGAAESVTVAFEEQLPAEVTVADSQNRICRHFTLWEDGRNNRFLVFDATGALIKGGHLGLEDAISLEPGEYTVVSRFAPDGFEARTDEICHEPKMYVSQVELGPGERVNLQRGPAKACLQAQARPRLVLRGESIRGVKGDEVYASRGLRLELAIPRELIEVSASGFRLRLDPRGLAEPHEVDVPLDCGESFLLDIEALGQQWRPGVGRLLVELHRRGLQRPVARLGALIWNGLGRVEERVRFHCLRFPQNIDEKLSDNAQLDREHGSLSYRDGNKRFFRLVFSMPNDRTQTFTWSVPGVFLSLKDYREDQVHERSVRKGSVLVVRGDSREVLEVHSTGEGELTLGDFRLPITTRTGMRRVHLSGLVEYLAPGKDTLAFLAADTETPEPLVRLVMPHQVLNFSVSRTLSSFKLRLRLTNGCEALRCHALELLGGRKEDLDLFRNDPGAFSDASAKAWLLSEPAENGERHEEHILECPLDRWPSGAWLLTLDVKIDGRWGTLGNARQDAYAGGFIIGDRGHQAGPDWLKEGLLPLLAQERLRVFKRVHEALLPCYAEESWVQLEWLNTIWHVLAGSFRRQEETCLTDLLTLSALRPPETSSASWFPLVSIGAYLPRIYCQSTSAYRGLAGRPDPIGIMSRIRPPLCNLFGDNVLDLAVAAGFENLAQMNRGGEPRKFSFMRYRQAMEATDISERWSLLRREDWRPGPGDYLGPMHYRYAIESLRTNYRDTLEGNERRRGWALRLVNGVRHRNLESFCVGCPDHLRRGFGLGLLESEPEEGWDQEQDNLIGITRLLCLFAAVCRWESRIPGALQEFQETLENTLDIDQDALHQAVGYLLHVGADLFAFHLLLWEFLFTADAGGAKENVT